MAKVRFRGSVGMFLLALFQLGCESAASGEAAPSPAAGVVASAQAGAAAPAPGGCVIAKTCLDLDVPPLTAAACCTPVSSCGYVFPEPDPETLMFFPEIAEFRAAVVKDDPLGRCAPESFYFGVQAGLNEERYEEPGVPDVLIASTCSSFHIAAFTLPGCCMPDSTCGLSTHANGLMFAETVGDLDAPFAKPECVRAEVLNEQFRASKLGSLARLKGGGTCNYAEIDARQPHLP